MATSILAGLNQEATQEELLTTATYYLAAILEKMARLDTNDRVAVRIEALDSVTLSTVGQVNGMGARAVDASAIPFQMSIAGTSHIYSNIIVNGPNFGTGIATDGVYYGD